MRLLLPALLLFFVHVSLAQGHKPAVQALPAASQTLVIPSDPSLHFNQQPISGGRIDVDSGVMRAAYRIAAPGPALATPEQTARAWMEENSDRFGWAQAEELVLTDEVRTPYSTHLTFQQVFHGIPVHRRKVKISLDSDGLPTLVFSGYAPGISALNASPAVSAEAAKQRAQALVSTTGATSTEPVLVVYPLAIPVLAWRVTAWPARAPGEWEVLVDAHSGVVIHLLDQALYHHTPDSLRMRRRITGRGQVWIPDPITSAGVPYGGAYVDNGDANSDALNDERRWVSLQDIEQSDDNRYRLRGPYVRIDGSIGDAYTPPDEANEDDFDYLRANQHFEAVMVYYHIDNSQRYVQLLAIGRGIQDGGLQANPHGLGSDDNAAYFPGLNAVMFGDGGIDDAEDAEVIIHEYGHALLEASSAGLSSTGEGGALHEGWSDYWAVSYTRGLMDVGAVPAHDWQHVFTWDGNETWSGRRLGSTATYPGGFGCVNNSSACNIYADGLIWATSMMEIYDAVGKRITDRLNLASHGYLNPPVTFVDAAEAIVQADKDYHQGDNVIAISRLLINRGYITDTEPPVIVHQSPAHVASADWPLRVDATITDALNIASAWVSFEVVGEDGSTGHTGSFSLVASGNQYSGSFPAMNLPVRSRVHYRIWARDDSDAQNLGASPPEAEPPFVIDIMGAADRVSVLSRATATGLWAKDGAGGYASVNPSSDLVSSIVLDPVDLPANAGVIALQLDHTANLRAAGGNVKVSSTETVGWQVLHLEGLYGESFAAAHGHPMQGEPVLASYRDEITRLDLTEHAGGPVWIRIDLGTNGSLSKDESWVIRSAVVESFTADEFFTVEPVLELHSNFPDPFSGRTTISYSLPESMPVRMILYNVLGQRVTVLVDEERGAGTHTLHLDLPGLAGGIYFLHMRTRSSTLTEPMVIAR